MAIPGANSVMTAIEAVPVPGRRKWLVAEVREIAAETPHVKTLWLDVPEPWNRVEFATHLRSQRVGVVLSDTFTVADAPPEAVRVCLGGPVNREECRHSLEIIADALEHLPALAARAM